MELHKQSLLKLCRLCRGVIKTTHGYRRVKSCVELKLEISSLFSYNVDIDDVDIHPQSLCGNCVRQVMRVNTKNSCNEIAKIAEFHSHRESCFCNGRVKLEKHTFSVIKKKSKFDKITNLSNFTQVEFQNEDFRIYVRHVLQGNGVYVDITLKVSNDFTWVVSVFNKELAAENKFLKDFPEKLTIGDAENMLSKLSSAVLCCGNNDFPLTIGKRKESVDIGTSNRLESEQFDVFHKIKTTVRNENCQVLITNSGNQCFHCNQNRKSLDVIEKRLEKYGSTVKPKRPHASMTKTNLRKRLFVVGKENKMLKRRQKIIEKQIDKIVMREGVKLDTGTETLMKEIANKDSKTPFEEGSVMYLLWSQQKAASSFKQQSSMRWHPVMIRWCLSIYLHSPGI